MINTGASIGNTLVGTLNNIILFIPHFISGLILLIIGVIVAGLAKMAVTKGAQLLNVDTWFEKARVEDSRTTDTWINVLSQVVYWFVLLSFAIPAFSAWQVPTITTILNSFVLYLPNVFAAVIIGFVGFIFANILSEAARNASKGLGQRASEILGNVARFAILIFAAMFALNQLQVSPNLIQIMLGGLVAMLALGGGLALGLGGRDAVRQSLDQVMNKRSQVGKAVRKGVVYAHDVEKDQDKN